MDRLSACLAFLLLVVAAACSDSPSSPAELGRAVFGHTAGDACPPNPDFVVRTEDELRTAVATAAPGDVIAVEGVVGRTPAEVLLATPDLTLTCATPGAGLRGVESGWLLTVSASRVTVERLTLDATAGGGVYLAHHDPLNGRFAEDVRVVGNAVMCGPTDLCVVYGGFPGGPAARGALVVGNRFTSTGTVTALLFHEVEEVWVEGNTFHGAEGADQAIRVSNQPGHLRRTVITRNTLAGAWVDPLVVLNTEGLEILRNTVTCGSSSCVFGIGPGLHGAIVADNSFTSAGSITGVHLQNGTDGSRVERNTIVATGPSTSVDLGGIRVRDGSDVVVSDNVVRGAWQNSLALANLTRSAIDRNRLEGAEVNGIRFSAVSPERPVSMTDNMFRDNRVRAAGGAAMLIRHACGNAFLGTRLGGQAGAPGAIFEETTGANVLVLLSNTIVIDNALPLDCNGDGFGDPNIITGPGQVRRDWAASSPAGVEGESSGPLR